MHLTSNTRKYGQKNSFLIGDHRIDRKNSIQVSKKKKICKCIQFIE